MTKIRSTEEAKQAALEHRADLVGVVKAERSFAGIVFFDLAFGTFKK